MQVALEQTERQSNASIQLQRCWRGKMARDKNIRDGRLSEAQLEKFLTKLMGKDGARCYLPQFISRSISVQDLEMLSVSDMCEVGFPVIASPKLA